jgi:hypothetical protein
MQSTLSYIGRRLLEPSTWAGLALMATAVAHLLQGDPSSFGQLVAQIAGGLLAAAIPEGKKPAAS